MVKGVSRRVIVVDSPDPKLFERGLRPGGRHLRPSGQRGLPGGEGLHGGGSGPPHPLAGPARLDVRHLRRRRNRPPLADRKPAVVI